MKISPEVQARARAAAEREEVFDIEAEQRVYEGKLRKPYIAADGTAFRSSKRREEHNDALRSLAEAAKYLDEDSFDVTRPKPPFTDTLNSPKNWEPPVIDPLNPLYKGDGARSLGSIWFETKQELRAEVENTLAKIRGLTVQLAEAQAELALLSSDRRLQSIGLMEEVSNG